MVRCQKEASNNLHNHPIHASSKIAQCVKEKISAAVIANPALTPLDIAHGKGMGFIPSAVDKASTHTGIFSQQIKNKKNIKGFSDRDWSPIDFEETANCVDEDDSDFQCEQDKKKYGRPYLVSSGIEEGIKYIFTMSPTMTKVACDADFIQADITYDDCREYLYLFNAVAFNKVTMDWMVIGRIRLNSQSASAYGLAFRKLFEKCKRGSEQFEIGVTLKGIVTDWSNAEISGLRMAVGKVVAKQLLKGCKVHWQRSCQRVAERVTSSSNKKREGGYF